jgi:hypothetical protein
LCHVGIGIVQQDEEDGELFVRARRERSLRGQQPDVVCHFAAAEEIHQRRAETGVHQGRVPPPGVAGPDCAGRVGSIVEGRPLSTKYITTAPMISITMTAPTKTRAAS